VTQFRWRETPKRTPSSISPWRPALSWWPTAAVTASFQAGFVAETEIRVKTCPPPPAREGTFLASTAGAHDVLVDKTGLLEGITFPPA
jgi:hypothetical protein